MGRAESRVTGDRKRAVTVGKRLLRGQPGGRARRTDKLADKRLNQQLRTCRSQKKQRERHGRAGGRRKNRTFACSGSDKNGRRIGDNRNGKIVRKQKKPKRCCAANLRASPCDPVWCICRYFGREEIVRHFVLLSLLLSVGQRRQEQQQQQPRQQREREGCSVRMGSGREVRKERASVLRPPNVATRPSWSSRTRRRSMPTVGRV
jgi:hypothetical protein